MKKGSYAMDKGSDGMKTSDSAKPGMSASDMSLKPEAAFKGKEDSSYKGSEGPGIPNTEGNCYH